MNKKITFALLLAANSLAVSAQTVTTVKGQLKGGTTIDTLYTYVMNNEAVDTLKLDQKGKFTFTIPVKDDQKQAETIVFWKRGTDESTMQAIAVVQQKGNDVDLTIDLKKSKDGKYLEMVPTFKGNYAERMTYENLTYQYTSRRPDFTPDTMVARCPTFKSLEQYVDQRFNEIQQQLAKTKDAEFIASEKKLLEGFRTDYYYGYAINREQSGKTLVGDNDFNAFTSTVNLNDTTNEKQLLGYVQWYTAAHSADYLPLTGTAAQMKMIREKTQSQDVRNKIANNAMQTQMFYFMYGMNPAEPELKDFYEQYLQTTTDTTYQRLCHEQLEAIKNAAPGKEAINFKVYDADGKEYDFTDLVKGHITYVDFWATWCGPCCKEIPYLAKMVEEYKDDPSICIISISIDQDEAKWKAKLATDKPAWKQFIIRDLQNSEAIKGYSINSIPRFILFDQNGQLARSSAPRPSEQEIRLIISQLKK